MAQPRPYEDDIPDASPMDLPPVHVQYIVGASMAEFSEGGSRKPLLHTDLAGTVRLYRLLGRIIQAMPHGAEALTDTPESPAS